MKTTTITALNQLNRDFYNKQAESWINSRQYSWPSWSEFHSLTSLQTQTGLRVLDIGCGSGRLAHWLNERFPNLDYCGWDSSEKLISYANSQLSQFEWSKIDLIAQLQSDNLSLPTDYDLITIFGVWHHIPSLELRAKFWSVLLNSLKAGAEVWITFWAPDLLGFELPKQVAPPPGLDYQDLETGDSFLGWKNTSSCRYVHWIQPSELENLKQTALDKSFIWKTFSVTEPGERGNLCVYLKR